MIEPRSWRSSTISIRSRRWVALSSLIIQSSTSRRSTLAIRRIRAPAPEPSRAVAMSARQPGVEHAEAFPRRLIAQGTGDPGLARAGRPSQDHVAVLGDPAAGEQIADQPLVQAAARFQIEVLETGRLTQASALEPHFQGGVGPVSRFPLDQQSELIIEVELAAVVQPDQLLQRPGHTEQTQGLQLFQIGVMHGFSPQSQW